MREHFTEQNGYLISNLLYEGEASYNNSIKVGYKVISKSGLFMGLLDQNHIAVWNTKEDTLKVL